MNSQPRKSFEIKENEVHIWTLDTSVYSQILSNQSVLSKDESARANKFRFDEDRNTYIVGRIVLRTLLGNYLGKEPSEIDFIYNEQGKPNVINSTGINFNLSNSKSSVAIGICKDSLIGIDIEYNKRPIEIDEIAPKFFSKNEVDQLIVLPSNMQLDAFYNCWTRKEAFIKALGGGLTVPLDQFEVSLLSKEKPSLIGIEWDQDRTQNWKMHSFNKGNDYTGAIIVENSSSTFKEMVFELECLTHEAIKIN